MRRGAKALEDSNQPGSMNLASQRKVTVLQRQRMMTTYEKKSQEQFERLEPVRPLESRTVHLMEQSSGVPTGPISAGPNLACVGSGEPWRTMQLGFACNSQHPETMLPHSSFDSAMWRACSPHTPNTLLRCT
mmetsp:Transcript_45938/g.75637  ORF Transcript_45938/g.75637 Transcript_45938/m.75637 type:complete len:132 (+) Transcript_45938:557-952(+)